MNFSDSIQSPCTLIANYPIKHNSSPYPSCTTSPYFTIFSPHTTPDRSTIRLRFLSVLDHITENLAPGLQKVNSPVLGSKFCIHWLEMLCGLSCGADLVDETSKPHPSGKLSRNALLTSSNLDTNSLKFLDSKKSQ